MATFTVAQPKKWQIKNHAQSKKFHQTIIIIENIYQKVHHNRIFLPFQKQTCLLIEKMRLYIISV